MEKDTKIFLLTILIILIAFVSFNFIGISGGIITWEKLSTAKDIGGGSYKTNVPVCSDTDKGYNFGIRGKCVDSWKERYDDCSGSVLTEWYCSDTGKITGGAVQDITGEAIQDITGEPIIGWDLSYITRGQYCYSKTFDCSKIGKGYRCLGGVCVKLGKA